MPTLIDTRDAFRRLREQGGFTQEQADAIVDLFRDADEEVATRTDIDRLEERTDGAEERLTSRVDRVGDRVERLDGRMEGLEAHVEEKVPTKSEMEAMEERLQRKLTTRLFGAVGVLAALLAVFEFLV